MKKFGAVATAYTNPEYPGLHVQPATTFEPVLFLGQLTAAHVAVYAPVINGKTFVCASLDEAYPLLQIQFGKPFESGGHSTDVQVDKKKSGAAAVATTDPL